MNGIKPKLYPDSSIQSVSVGKLKGRGVSKGGEVWAGGKTIAVLRPYASDVKMHDG
jgi:hypothetical protein